MGNMPFKKGDHVRVVHLIAVGMNEAGFLYRYLELGYQRGTCFNKVAPLADEAYAVDINDNYSYIKNNKNCSHYHGTTTDFLNSHDKSKKFDMVFIDADHSHEASRRDFDMVLPLVNNNGMILLHDTFPPSEEFMSKKYCHDTYKTADYIRKAFIGECEIVTLPFYYGISIVRKIGEQSLWEQR